MSSDPRGVRTGAQAPQGQGEAERVDRLVRARYRAERRFQLYGKLAIGFSLAALVGLLASVAFDGISAFRQHAVQLEIDLVEEDIDPGGERTTESLAGGNYDALVRAALRALFPEVRARRDKRALYGLLSVGAGYDLQDYIAGHVDEIGTRRTFWLPVSDDADLYLKGVLSADGPESDRRLSDQQIAWLDQLIEAGLIDSQWNTRFMTGGDSREPELAGIQGAIRGSFLTLIVTLLLSFPVGVAAALYLEEFAHRNRFTDLIEVNINNLAAVPSIVFGLLGLSVFLNLLDFPRSAPLVGGMVLALMTLPTIIIASRAALAAVPPSIREAALGVGASPMQAVLHHVLPQALPGILTGTIIGMARALGETAPLLMIGMVAFIVDLPEGMNDPSTVLPVQIYLWSDAPERAFVEKTAAAILVLLGFLISMNAAAVWIRRRFETRY